MAAQMMTNPTMVDETETESKSVKQVFDGLTHAVDGLVKHAVSDKMLRVSVFDAAAPPGPLYFTSEPPTGHQGKSDAQKSASATQASKTRALNATLAPILAEDALRQQIKHSEHVRCLEERLLEMGLSFSQVLALESKSATRAESMATIRFHHQKLSALRALKLKKAIKKADTNAKQKTKRKAKTEAEQYAKAQKLIAEVDAKRAASAAAFE